MRVSKQNIFAVIRKQGCISALSIPCMQIKDITQDKGTLSAADLQKALGCSRTKAYSLITETRDKFKDEHKTIPPGYVSEKLFMGQLYGAAPRKENI